MGPQRVLVIEDSAADSALVTRYLAESDNPRFDVVQARTISEALKRLEVGVDVVLLDLMLPDNAGVEALAQLRDASPLTPVVVLSAAQNTELARHCIRSGASAYLSKHRLSQEGLCKALRGAIVSSRGGDAQGAAESAAKGESSEGS